MRIVSSFADVNSVIKPIQDFISLFKTKDTNRNGLRLKNNGDAVDPQDYVTLKQLSAGQNTQVNIGQFYTVVFTSSSVPSPGSTNPNWVTGIDRDGIPIQVWLKCVTAPSGGPCAINILLNGSSILTSNLSTTDALVHYTSSFVNPVPKLGLYSVLVPNFVSINGAANISIGVVIQRNGS